MSYPVDIDELPEALLVRELERRAELRREGLCDYCHREPSEPSCRFPERHARPERPGSQEGEPKALRRVWKPLDVGGLRLYEVLATYPSERHPTRYVVAATAPRDAARLIDEIMEGVEPRPSTAGFALNILQPKGWWVDGVQVGSREPAVDWERVCVWMRDPKRAPAVTAFTAGPERQLAYAFEDGVGSHEPDPPRMAC